MGLQSLDTCIGAFYCDATGYDTLSSKLVDKSGYGNDLSIKVGTAPVYATRAGFQVMDFDLTYYFEGENLWTSGGSCVFVGVCDQDGADGSQAIVNTLSRKATADNFAGTTVEAVNGDWVLGTYGRKAILLSSNGPFIFNWNGGAFASGSNFVAGAMNIFTAAVSLHPAQLQASTKTQAIVTAAEGSGSAAAIAGSIMRIGFLKASGTLTAGKYLSAKRIYFYTGNVFEHADFTTARAAEIATWGI